MTWWKLAKELERELAKKKMASVTWCISNIISSLHTSLQRMSGKKWPHNVYIILLRDFHASWGKCQVHWKWGSVSCLQSAKRKWRKGINWPKQADKITILWQVALGLIDLGSNTGVIFYMSELSLNNFSNIYKQAVLPHQTRLSRSPFQKMINKKDFFFFYMLGKSSFYLSFFYLALLKKII